MQSREGLLLFEGCKILRVLAPGNCKRDACCLGHWLEKAKAAKLCLQKDKEQRRLGLGTMLPVV